MSETKTYAVPQDVAASAHIDNETYLAMYERSISDPEGFWAEQAETFVHWFKKWSTVSSWDYHKGEIKWFEVDEIRGVQAVHAVGVARLRREVGVRRGDDLGEGRHLAALPAELDAGQQGLPL